MTPAIDFDTDIGLPDRKRVLRAVVLAALVLLALPLFLLAASNFVGFFDGYVVLTNSMAPHIRAGDVVFVHRVDPSAVHVGDVITYQSGGRHPVTHKVVDIVEQGGARQFETLGINNEAGNTEMVPAQALIGVVVFHVPYLGMLVTRMQTDLGLVAFVIVPMGLLILTEVWGMYKASRRTSGDTEE